MITEVLLPSFNKERKFILITWLCFIAVATFAIWHHELWRDEWQAWLIVKNSPDISSLFQKIRYEGHPSLWYVLLWLLQLVTDNAVSMKALHLLIAACIAFTWLRFAPFNKLLRVLFIFGYFPLFEFAVISRNYGIGLLLLFLFLAYFTYRRDNLILQSMLLALLMQTNLFASIIAATMSLAMMLSLYRNRKTKPLRPKRYLPALTVLLVGVGFCYLTVRPPADQFFGYLRQGIHWKDVKSLLPLFYQGMIPIPKPELHFWNTNMFLEMKGRFLLYFGLIVCIPLLFRQNLKILLIFIIGVTGIAALLYLKNLQFMRHIGNFYVLFVSCIWLLHSPVLSKTVLKNKSFLSSKFNSYIIGSIFTAHIVAAAISIVTDWKKPFSAAAAASKYIKENHLDTLPLTVESDFIGISITGYLDKQAYQLRTKKISDYVTWNTSRLTSVTEKEIITRAEDYARLQRKDVLMISSYKMPGIYPSIILLQSFTEAIQSDETYYLYKIHWKAP